MLEYNFTKLDDDFITLWSRVVLTGDIKPEMGALQELAEKGQINAVQSWYLFKAKGVNPTIDAIVEGYDGNTYNELFAKVNYLLTDDKTFTEYIDLMNKMWEELESWREGSYERFGNARRAVYDHPICANLIQACKIAIAQGKSVNNYLMLERYNEMQIAYRDKAPIVREDEMNELTKSIIKNNRIVIKELLKQYKELKAQGKNATDNPQLAFALGKALCLFPNKKKYKEFGASLLKELAERHYVYINPQTNFNI